jgi:hypothetical protein
MNIYPVSGIFTVTSSARSPAIERKGIFYVLPRMATSGASKKPYFGLTGGWLTFWITVSPELVGLKLPITNYVH